MRSDAAGYSRRRWRDVGSVKSVVAVSAVIRFVIFITHSGEGGMQLAL